MFLFLWQNKKETLQEPPMHIYALCEQKKSIYELILLLAYQMTPLLLYIRYAKPSMFHQMHECIQGHKCHKVFSVLIM